MARICAYLAWGNGWLHQLGFVDFAGSVVVHQAGRKLPHHSHKDSEKDQRQ